MVSGVCVPVYVCVDHVPACPEPESLATVYVQHELTSNVRHRMWLSWPYQIGHAQAIEMDGWMDGWSEGGTGGSTVTMDSGISCACLNNITIGRAGFGGYTVCMCTMASRWLMRPGF